MHGHVLLACFTRILAMYLQRKFRNVEYHLVSLAFLLCRFFLSNNAIKQYSMHRLSNHSLINSEIYTTFSPALLFDIGRLTTLFVIYSLFGLLWIFCLKSNQYQRRKFLKTL